MEHTSWPHQGPSKGHSVATPGRFPGVLLLSDNCPVPPQSPPRLDQRRSGSQTGRKIRWAAPRRQSGLGGLRAQSLLLTEFYLLWGSSCQGGKEKWAHPTLCQQLPSKTDSEPCHQITQKTQHSNLHCRDYPTHTQTHTQTHTHTHTHTHGKTPHQQMVQLVELDGAAAFLASPSV